MPDWVQVELISEWEIVKDWWQEFWSDQSNKTSVNYTTVLRGCIDSKQTHHKEAHVLDIWHFERLGDSYHSFVCKQKTIPDFKTNRWEEMSSLKAKEEHVLDFLKFGYQLPFSESYIHDINTEINNSKIMK